MRLFRILDQIVLFTSGILFKTQNRPQIVNIYSSRSEDSFLLPPSVISSRLTNFNFSSFVFEKSLHDEQILEVQTSNVITIKQKCHNQIYGHIHILMIPCSPIFFTLNLMSDGKRMVVVTSTSLRRKYYMSVVGVHSQGQPRISITKGG